MNVLYIVAVGFLSSMFRHRVKGLILLIVSTLLALHWFSFPIALVNVGVSLFFWGGRSSSDSPVTDPLFFTEYGNLMNFIALLLTIIGIIIALCRS